MTREVLGFIIYFISTVLKSGLPMTTASGVRKLGMDEQTLCQAFLRSSFFTLIYQTFSYLLVYRNILY